MRYRLPAKATFQARCPVPAPDALLELSADYATRGRARLVLDAHVECAGNRVADFEGTFIAMKGKAR
jgi:hypothetical protein